MKVLSFYLFFALIIINCSAVNVWNQYNQSNNTNPTPEYSNFNSLFFKGGYVFHMNHLPGGLGENAESKLAHTNCNHSILYIASFGDSSVGTIVKEANIKKIAFVSYEQFAILSFVYHRFCTTVAGE